MSGKQNLKVLELRNYLIKPGERDRLSSILKIILLIRKLSWAVTRSGSLRSKANRTNFFGFAVSPICNRD